MAVPNNQKAVRRRAAFLFDRQAPKRGRMDAHDHWRKVYQAKRPDEVSWYQPSPEPSLAALDGLGARPSMSLVDVGGGASSLVDALIDRGWSDLTVVDIAEPALAASKARLGARAERVDWQIADILHWAPSRQFDVWHDRAVIHFLTTADERAAYRRALQQATRAGSLVIIAAFAADGPEKCSGLPVQRYDANELAGELGEGLAPVADWHEVHITPWGAEQNFQWATFTRR